VPGPDRYPAFTKILHWLTAAALAAQFVVGYAMDVDSGGRGRGRGRGSAESGRGRGRGGDDGYEVFGADRLLTVHVALGVSIVVLTAVRLLWRRHAGLPPWAPQLGPAGRTLAHWTERALYALLFVIPLSGLWLVVVSDEAVAVHIGAHIALFVAVAAHLGLVLTRRLLPRML
jgi:cytochrome b561